jgi:hypothetical protein
MRIAMREKIKFWSAVTVLTVLIWVAAGQNVDEEKTFQIPLRLMSDDPNRYAAITEPSYQTTFVATFRGRRRHLKEFSDLAATKTYFEVVIDRSQPSNAKPQSLSARELLLKIKPAPLTLYSVEPDTVLAIVDDYVTVHDVRVEPVLGDLKVSAVPTPTKVSVRLPRFAAEWVQADPVAVADAERVIRAGSWPDGSFKIKVPLRLKAIKDDAPEMQVKIIPSDTVTLSGQIESLTQTKRIGPIQVTLSIPKQVQQAFDVKLDEAANLRPDIDVVGPRVAIDQLDPRDIRAFVDVLAADTEKPQTQIRRAVQFVLPQGFTLSEGSPKQEVTFTLEPRAATPEGPG